MFIFFVQEEAVRFQVSRRSTWDACGVNYLVLPSIPCLSEVGGDGVKEGGPSLIVGSSNRVGETSTCEDTVGEGIKLPADGAVQAGHDAYACPPMVAGEDPSKTLEEAPPFSTWHFLQ